MKKIAKYLLSLVFVLSIAIIPAASILAAGPTEASLGIDAGSPAAGLGLGEKSPLETATALINTAMLFLGIIAVCIVLLAGFKWMTAGGNEDKVGEAKKLMASGVIGLIILLSAWGIAKYVIKTSIAVTSTGVGTTK
ncbi:MAG: hypothetical protein WAW11_00795 [Patescibacteria group bacterium]|jgi:hypothetical protein